MHVEVGDEALDDALVLDEGHEAELADVLAADAEAAEVVEDEDLLAVLEVVGVGPEDADALGALGAAGVVEDVADVLEEHGQVRRLDGLDVAPGVPEHDAHALLEDVELGLLPALARPAAPAAPLGLALVGEVGRGRVVEEAAPPLALAQERAELDEVPQAQVQLPVLHDIAQRDLLALPERRVRVLLGEPRLHVGDRRDPPHEVRHLACENARLRVSSRPGPRARSLDRAARGGPRRRDRAATGASRDATGTPQGAGDAHHGSLSTGQLVMRWMCFWRSAVSFCESSSMSCRSPPLRS